MSSSPIRRKFGASSIRRTLSSPLGVRTVIKTRGSVPTDEAALKLVYLALRNITARWTMPVKEWRAALNRFAILFEDRMPVF